MSSESCASRTVSEVEGRASIRDLQSGVQRGEQDAAEQVLRTGEDDLGQVEGRDHGSDGDAEPLAGLAPGPVRVDGVGLG